MSNLTSERLDGFVSGTSTQIKVSGSRTVGGFTLPDNMARIDTAAVGAALRDSMTREGRDFARVTEVAISKERPAALQSATPIVLSTLERKLLADMNLVGVRTVDSTNASGNWLTIEAKAQTYSPGSTVYLIVTSTPIVIGVAQIGADGTASLQGSVPLEMLGGGSHRVRIVGSREFGNVAANTQGAAQVPPATMEQVKLFDTDTTAVVEVIGAGSAGTTHQVVRYIALNEVRSKSAPYWMMLAMLALLLLVFYRSLRGGLNSLRARLLTAVILSAFATSLMYAAWLDHFPDVSGAVMILLLVGLRGILDTAPVRKLRLLPPPVAPPHRYKRQLS